jgi:hypothetical protein
LDLLKLYIHKEEETMAIVKKILWAIFVGISGLFTGLMVEKGLKSVYDPSESKGTNEDEAETKEDEAAATETACEPSVPESETEKGDSEDDEPSNEE